MSALCIVTVATMILNQPALALTWAQPEPIPERWQVFAAPGMRDANLELDAAVPPPRWVRCWSTPHSYWSVGYRGREASPDSVLSEPIACTRVDHDANADGRIDFGDFPAFGAGFAAGDRTFEDFREFVSVFHCDARPPALLKPSS